MDTKNKGYKNRIKFLIIFVFIVIGLQIFSPTLAYGASNPGNNDDERSKILQEQSQSDEIKKMQQQLNKFTGGDVENLIPGYDPDKIIGNISGGDFSFSFTGFLDRAIRYLFKEIYLNIGILIKLVILVILCSLLKNLQTSFLSESVGELAFYACYIVIVSIMLISLGTVLTLARDIIDSLVGFMHATLPVLITMLISSGNLTSAGIFQPILIMMVEVTATVIKNILLPLVFLSMVLSIVDNISDKVQISGLAQLLKQVTGWILGFILTVFIGILAIQGSIGAAVDGVTSKTTKFAIGALIPVVGKYLADAADAVVGCTLLIKNAAGVAVMLGIIAICLVPLIKIFALIALYRITCVLIEPIADKRITKCLSQMASSLTYIFGIAAAVSFMFLISITAIISASNISAMMR